MIFSNIEDFKVYVGGAVNKSVELDSLQPAYHEVLQKNIIPLLGQTLWNTVSDTWNNNPTSETTALLPFIKRPLSQLTMFEYAKIGNIQFSESGMMRVETDQMKSAYKYQEKQYQDWMRTAGYNSLEELQLFLMENKANYADWPASESFRLMINTARTFRSYFGKQVNRYIFEILRPIIEEVEIFVIEPSIGTAQYDILKTAIAEANADDDQLILLHKLYRALAHFTIEEAMHRQFVKFDGDQVVKMEGLEPQTYTKTSNASGKEVEFARRYHQFRAAQHLKRALTFLQDNLDTYPEYKAFYEAQQAAESEDNQISVRPDYPNPPADSNDSDQGGLILLGA
ncbi:MAG: DUF6712 family protein [Bacteroidota bacterium]